ncbi:kinesin-like protein [Achlya hypogyna]|uniref:Kinesin-like protein n=1 Tax=Achlya hypogyna TaxID=1202772 RepID=A0A1V9Z7M0_ACHHY|nr:kinesin-like protein [Achlya hypogyna]
MSSASAGSARGGQCVEVAVRVRPFLPKELLRAGGAMGEGTGAISLDKERKAIEIATVNSTANFYFDHVLGPDCTQAQMYDETLRPKLDHFLNGFNTTIIGYGQTASGKSHTIGSGLSNQDEEEWGLLPRMLHDLFERISVEDGAHVSVSFLEIYGEDIHDLLLPLSSSKKAVKHALHLRQDRSGVFVQGAREVAVTTPEDALEQLRVGCLTRITGSTEMNDVSSRSHAVFTLTLVQKTKDKAFVDAMTTISKLTFVDLAGSERLKKTMADGQRMKEGIQINVGLLALGNVINALGDEQNQRRADAGAFVPYRSSKLTRLLQDALGGNSRTLFVACVSPAASNAAESLNTLHYANRARNIQNKAVKNLDARSAELSSLHAYIAVLQRELVKSLYVDPAAPDRTTALDALLQDDKVQHFLRQLQTSASDDGWSAAPVLGPATALRGSDGPATDDTASETTDDGDDGVDPALLPGILSILECCLEKEAVLGDYKQAKIDLQCQMQATQLRRRREQARWDTLREQARPLEAQVKSNAVETWMTELNALQQEKLHGGSNAKVDAALRRLSAQLQAHKKVATVLAYTQERAQDAQDAVRDADAELRQLEERLHKNEQHCKYTVKLKNNDIQRYRDFPNACAKWNHLAALDYFADLEQQYGPETVKKMVRQLTISEQLALNWLERHPPHLPPASQPVDKHMALVLDTIQARLTYEDTEASLMEAIRKRTALLTQLLNRGASKEAQNDLRDALSHLEGAIALGSDTLRALAPATVLEKLVPEDGGVAQELVVQLVLALEHSERLQVHLSDSRARPAASRLTPTAASTNVLLREEYEQRLHALKVAHEQEKRQWLAEQTECAAPQAQWDALQEELHEARKLVEELTAQVDAGQRREVAFSAVHKCQELMEELGLQDGEREVQMKELAAKCQADLDRLLAMKQESNVALQAIVQQIMLCDKALGTTSKLDFPARLPLTIQVQQCQGTLRALEKTIEERVLQRLRNLKLASDLCDELQMGANVPVPTGMEPTRWLGIISKQSALQSQIADTLDKFHGDMCVFAMFDQIGEENADELAQLTKQLLLEGTLPLHDQNIAEDMELIALLQGMKNTRCQDLELCMHKTRDLYLELQFTPADITAVSDAVVATLSFPFSPENLLLRLFNTGGMLDISTQGLCYMHTLCTSLDLVRQARLEAHDAVHAMLAQEEALYNATVAGNALLAHLPAAKSPPKALRSERHVTNAAMGRLCEQTALWALRVRRLVCGNLRLLEEELDSFGIEDAQDRVDFIVGSRDRAAHPQARALLRQYHAQGPALPAPACPPAPELLHALDPYRASLGAELALALRPTLLEELTDELAAFEGVQSVLQDARARLDSLGSIMKCVAQIRGYNKKITEFEAAASDSDRLLDRRGSSLRLLEEEKFRKTAAKKYPQLVQKVRDEVDKWTGQSARGFELDILGDDLQALLKDTMQYNTEFMHLSLMKNTRPPKAKRLS